MVYREAGEIFPGYFAARFRIPVQDEHESRIPDLALIDRSYRRWWVVEVEMAHHSLNSHVLPQIEVFSKARYGEEHARYLVENSTGLDSQSVSDMIKGTQPRVVVVVNQEVPTWVDSIRRVGCLLMIVQVFRSPRNQHILRVNGDTLGGLPAEVVSACRPDRIIPRLIEIDSPASLGIPRGGRLTIHFNEGITDWERIDSADKVWLSPIGNNPLLYRREYQISRDELGRLFFELAQ